MGTTLQDLCAADGALVDAGIWMRCQQCVGDKAKRRVKERKGRLYAYFWDEGAVW